MTFPYAALSIQMTGDPFEIEHQTRNKTKNRDKNANELCFTFAHI